MHSFLFFKNYPTKGLILVALIFSISLEASAKSKLEEYLEVIGPPPAAGSAEELLDLDILLNYQDTRTEKECELASLEESVSDFSALFAGENGPLTEKEVKKHRFFFWKYLLKAGLPNQKVKKFFQRPRPFLTFGQLDPCIKQPSGYSYPSGHTMVSRLMAHGLALKYPERAEAIYKRADEIARNRMLGGVHYPSDIAAGKKLADYLFSKMKKSKKLIKELMKD